MVKYLNIKCKGVLSFQMIVENKKIHVLIIGVAYIGTMASAMRIRNLIDPLINKLGIKFSNLIFPSPPKKLNKYQGYKNKVLYQVIDYNIFNLLSIVSFFIQGCLFIHRNRKTKFKNILYVYQYPNIENIVFILFAKLIKYKVVFDIVEDFNYVDDFKSLKGKFKTQSALFFFKKIKRIADGCCAISYHVESLLRKISNNKFPVQLIPISVNLSDFPKIKIDSKQCNTTTFFYGGSFGENDGIECLLNAFAIVAETHKNVRLILTGAGADRHINKLKELLEKNQYKKKISYLGYLPCKEYFQVLNECNVMCMCRINSPFANAGFPFKLGEYLATSKTVIATNIGDVPKYLTHMKNSILVEPENEYSIAQAMIFCVQNPEECEKIGTNGRKVVEESFDSIRISEKLLEFFQIL